MISERYVPNAFSIIFLKPGRFQRPVAPGAHAPLPPPLGYATELHYLNWQLGLQLNYLQIRYKNSKDVVLRQKKNPVKLRVFLLLKIIVSLQ